MADVLLDTMIVGRRQAHAAPLLLLLLLRLASLVAALVAAAWTTADPALWGHIRFGHDAIVIVLGLMTLRVSRLDGFFSLAVVVLLGPIFAHEGPATRRCGLPRCSGPRRPRSRRRA